MSTGRPGNGLRDVQRWQKDAARAEYLRHPESSISDVAKATNVAVRTAARARAELVKEGLLPSQKRTPSQADAAVLAQLAAEVGSVVPEPEAPAEGPTDVTDPTSEPKAGRAKRDPAGTVDGEALRVLSGMLDDLTEEDDDLTRKRLLKQLKRFIFDPSLLADTRMAASQLWTKLFDMARAKDLGPGKPLTLSAAIDRCYDFLTACGPAVYVPAYYRVIGEPMPNAATGSVDTPASPQAPAEPAGPPNDNPPLPPQT
jgi:hypothetical protein